MVFVPSFCMFSIVGHSRKRVLGQQESDCKRAVGVTGMAQSCVSEEANNCGHKRSIVRTCRSAVVLLRLLILHFGFYSSYTYYFGHSVKGAEYFVKLDDALLFHLLLKYQAAFFSFATRQILKFQPHCSCLFLQN